MPCGRADAGLQREGRICPSHWWDMAWFPLCLLPLSCMDGQASYVHHPTGENQPTSSVIIEGQTSRAMDCPSPVGFLERTDSIGTNESPEEEVFGHIQDVVVDQFGTIYILDSQSGEIKAFDLEGRHLFTGGGLGGGPNEFVNPADLILPATNTLLVVDRGGWLKEVDLSTPDRIVGLRATPLPYSPTSGCSIGDTIFVRGGVQSGNTIQAHTVDGSRVRSFGSPYQSTSSHISWQLSRGTIACDQATGTVVDVSLLFPFVRGYSTTGEHKWTAKFSDFLQMEIVERTDIGGLGFRGRTAHELGLRALPLGGGDILVQTMRRYPVEPGNHEMGTKVRSFLIRSHDGSGHLFSDALPLILAVHGTTFIGMEEDPFPRVIFLENSNPYGGS